MEGHIQRLIREVQKKARWVGGLLKMRLHGQFYLPIRKTPERSVSVKLELVQIFLVLDTDIEATANQRWTSDGAPHESSRLSCGDCNTMASQSVQ